MRRTLSQPGPQGRQLSKLAVLTFALYFATLSVDAVRKVAGLPASAIGVVYVATALIYVSLVPVTAGRARITPRLLPMWLLMLSAWCIVVALVQHITLQMALLGWASYVYFVPLLYVGAELAADDRLAAKCLRIAVIGGGVVGAGAIASAILGQSAPALLQPIIPSVGVHSFVDGNIYLSPSIFATAEEASEQLLIALFAWAALSHLPDGISRPKRWRFLVMLILAGLIVAARRADIYVAIGGMVAALLLGRTGLRAPTPRAPAPPAVDGLATAKTRRLIGPVLLAAAGAVALVLLLGDNSLASFLASGSPGSRISAMFSLPSSGSVLGQGPGTSTQGVAVVDAISVSTGSNFGLVRRLRPGGPDVHHRGGWAVQGLA